MLSHESKQKLDDVIEAATKEKHTLWGFILNADGSELQAFGNSGDEISAWIHNVDTALAALREELQVNQPVHEA